MTSGDVALVLAYAFS